MTADVSTPVVVFRAQDYGALGIVRTLGRLGVAVHVVDADRWAFAPASRYCASRFRWDFDAPEAESVAFLRDVAARVGGRPILVHTGDSTAKFLSRHAAELRDVFRFPVQPEGLVDTLADKRSMYHLCRRLGIPTAETLFPESHAELEEQLGRLQFPVMLKANDGRRLQMRTGLRMLIAHDREEALAAYDRLEDPAAPNLMLQEYIPGDDASVWMFNGYFDERSECRFGLTGRKLRQHPVHTGMTCLGICLPNEEVERATRDLARATGYRGIMDIGYRYDERDGRYKLLDVNPRVGVTFRLFVGRGGMDVVRAMYLDLTGQEVPADSLTPERRWLVEDKDVVSSWRYHQEGGLSFREWAASLRGVRESAYFAVDDPRPFAQMLAHWAWVGLRGAIARPLAARAAVAPDPSRFSEWSVASPPLADARTTHPHG